MRMSPKRWSDGRTWSAFFEHIGQPLKQVSETTKAFREMMLSGRVNKLMREAVEDAQKRE